MPPPEPEKKRPYRRKAGEGRPRKPSKDGTFPPPSHPDLIGEEWHNFKSRAPSGLTSDYLTKRRREKAKKQLEKLRKEWPARVAKHKERALGSCYYFVSEVLHNDQVIDPYYHGLLCKLIEHGQTMRFKPGDYYFPDRKSLVDSRGELTETYRIGAPSRMGLVDRLQTDPTNMDGTFRGMFIRIAHESEHKAFLLYRGSLKTTIVTVGGLLWRLARDPTERILIAMNSGPNARNVVRDMKSHFECNPDLREAFPHLIPPFLLDEKQKQKKSEDGLRWQANLFDLPTSHQGEGYAFRREASVQALGIGSRLVSQHYTHIHCDDLCDDRSITTAEKLDKTIQEFLALQSLGIGDCTSLDYVGTPYSSDDVSQYILDPKGSGFKHLNLIVATVEGRDGEPMYPAKRKAGHPGMTRKKIEKLRHKQARHSFFSSQYLIQPVDDKLRVFKGDDWQWYDEAEFARKPRSNWKIVLTVDPAISEEKQGDFSAFVVVAIDPMNQWYVREICHHRQLGVPGIVETVYGLYARHRPDIVGIESNGFQRTLSYVFNDECTSKGRQALPLYPVLASITASKEWRIKRIAPKVASKGIYLPRHPDFRPKTSDQRRVAPPGIRELLREADRFPKTRRDDVLDALCMVMDLNFGGDAEEEEREETMVRKFRRQLREEHFGGEVDDVLGSEF